jgi:hypothetical protein
LDTGAQKAVIGRIKAECFSRENNFLFNIALQRDATRPRFKFGSKVSNSIGLIQIHIPVPGPTKHIKLLVDVVDLDIPLLLGLDFLDKHKLC